MKGRSGICKGITMGLAALLLAGIVHSTLRLAHLRWNEERLDDARNQVATSRLGEASESLAAIAGRGLDSLSPRQNRILEELVLRLVETSVRTHPPIDHVAGKRLSMNGRETITVAVARVPAMVRIQPAAIARWVEAVRLGDTLIPLSGDEATASGEIALDTRGLEMLAPREVAVVVIVRLPGGDGHEIPAGSFRLGYDSRPPSVTVRLGREDVRIDGQSAEERTWFVRPGTLPLLLVEDGHGLESVRWNVQGASSSRTFEKPWPRRWKVPLDAEAFARSGRDLVIRLVPQNVLGVTADLHLRFKIRDAAFNPVLEVLVGDETLVPGQVLLVDDPRVVVRVETAPGEDTSRLALTTGGGRRYELKPDGSTLRAEIVLDEGTPTGITILNGERVLMSYVLQVKRP